MFVTKRLDAEAIVNLQNYQYRENILLSDTVPASSQKLGRVNISNLGHFYCLFITGHFTTVKRGQEESTDDGVNHLRGKLIDGGNQRALFNDYVPLDLILTPGRVRTILDLTGDPSNNLFYPIEFNYLFTANGSIMFDVKNDATYDNNYEICFHGYRIKARPGVAGV